MAGCGRDPDTGWYFIDGGATLWNVYRRFFVEHGVTLPGGSCATVGAGGHITGGGYGLLSRLHGLTVDWLSAVDVVVISPMERLTWYGRLPAIRTLISATCSGRTRAAAVATSGLSRASGSATCRKRPRPRIS